MSIVRGKEGELCITPILQRRWAFPQFRGSRASFFSDLFTSRFKEAGLRIPFDRLRAAVSPIPKSRKELHPPPVTAKKPIVFFWDDGNCHVLQRSRRIFILHGTTIGADGVRSNPLLRRMERRICFGGLFRRMCGGFRPRMWRWHSIASGAPQYAV